MKEILLFVALLFVFERASSAICGGTNCVECVSSGYNCAWCIQKNFTAPRCQSRRLLEAAGCDEGLIEDPQVTLSLLENNPVQDSTTTDQAAVQVQPQEVELKTRPGLEQTVPMTFRAANNYPVDLYFLFDISLSMKVQIENLAKLASDIGQAIGEISSNYRMGYGVFQDKRAMPFTDTSPIRLLNPCEGSNARTCAPPFEFKHILNMTKDLELFKRTVRATNITGNLDHPEGSGDAIVQAVTCKREIGWREIGRKLLIFASNDRFHLAGDGRLGGIVMPNDGRCHLDAHGEYTEELVQDYPSVGQLADIALKNEVHIIFAVTDDQTDAYRLLSERIPESIVELLEQPDGPSNRNIRDIVERKYRDMVSEVKIVSDKVEGVEINVRAKSSICEKQGTNVCKGLQIGTEIKFDVDVKVTECPATEDDRFKTVVLYPASLKSDQVLLEIEILCDCSCESKQDTWEENSEICTGGNGTLKCGQCDCNPGRFGQLCECDASDIGATGSEGCIEPGSNSTEACSGNGVCECKQCICEQGFSGPYCECDDTDCDVFRREICGGPSRGRCQCGGCICESDYEGVVCECPTSNQTCIDDKGVLCSDKGECVCGQCRKCQKGYIGSFCETCILCGDDVCDIMKYRECAACELEGDGADRKCADDCPQRKVVKTLNSEEVNFCSVKQSDGCFLSYQITLSGSEVVILVQKTRTCSEPVDIVPIVGWVVGGVLLVGILSLIFWKVLTSMFDHLEYSRFQEDLQKCRWAQQDNPFYRGATTTYQNPMLDRSEPRDHPM
ncbi:integrin beta-6 [Aplysia californica]|uniref:Integrin beta n=1 Tax=Aplysia californica TaxID=6500 RepID=A0ABM1AED5_APLCA|nr:integrin beta-6 [Aplysia californica]